MAPTKKAVIHLDPDVHAALKRNVQKTGVYMRRFVNDALRKALKLRAPACVLTCVFGLYCAFSATPTKPVATPAPVPAPAPQLTAEQRAAFWRANSEASAAANQALVAEGKARDAMAAAKALTDELRKACGATQDLVIDAKGEPSCAAKSPAK